MPANFTEPTGASQETPQNVVPPDHDHTTLHPHSHCENCGTELAGPYCHQCGQKDYDFNRSFRHVVVEVLESFYHFDSKLSRAFVYLLIRPGKLTVEFIKGHRASQVPPFRLYLFVSILFFITFGQKADQQDRPIRIEGVSASEISPESSDSSITKVDSIVLDRFYTGLRHLETDEGRRHLNQLMSSGMSRLMLICIPLLALFTRFLYRKSGYGYLQHLVIALHYQSFVFLWSMTTDGWIGLISLAASWLGTPLKLAALGWSITYPLLVLKTVFGQSWSATVGKLLLITLIYSFCLLLGVSILAGISLMLI